MGWSCTRTAGHTLDAITEHCIAETGQQNVFTNRGNRYMLEVGREQSDGAICATIYKFLEGNSIKRSGSLRIEPNGKISRGPHVFKKLRVLILKIDRIPTLWRKEWGEPTEENVAKQLQEWNDSYKPGGLNEHVSKQLGHLKVVDHAEVVDLDGNVVAEHRHGAFQVI